ncbi:hypothetical protein M8818_003113 [Zalaria obscura]|uniref:Uncharacterized protein n=1 Tax=Zalaria obscura TaxID=2024903 RepID=A0ACC3SGZ7_9PEZI
MGSTACMQGLRETPDRDDSSHSLPQTEPLCIVDGQGYDPSILSPCSCHSHNLPNSAQQNCVVHHKGVTWTRPMHTIRDTNTTQDRMFGHRLMNIRIWIPPGYPHTPTYMALRRA